MIFIVNLAFFTFLASKSADTTLSKLHAVFKICIRAGVFIFLFSSFRLSDTCAVWLYIIKARLPRDSELAPPVKVLTVIFPLLWAFHHWMEESASVGGEPALPPSACWQPPGKNSCGSGMTVSCGFCRGDISTWGWLDFRFFLPLRLDHFNSLTFKFTDFFYCLLKSTVDHL